MIVLQWWLMFCSSVTAVFLCWQFGLLDALERADKSYLGFACIAIYFLASLYAGWVSHGKAKGIDVSKRLPVLWLTSETLVSIGLAGTLVGFVLMLSGGLDSINPGNVAEAQKALGAMAVGMSTAVATTLVGLVTSTALKFQLVSLE